MSENKLVLLLGATGKSGYHVANVLVSAGFHVRIVVRSAAKAEKLFKEKEIAFESIIEGDLDNEEILERAFAPSKFYGPVKIVVSALGAVYGCKPEEVEKVEYLWQVKLIQRSVAHKIEKYIFITGALIERPWFFVTIMLNTIVPNVYHWKVQAENYLRKSGLDYAIVRPTRLVGDENDLTLGNVTFDQGDKLNRRISRYSLAHVVLQTIKVDKLPKKVTFECTGSHEPTRLSLESLTPDTEESILHINHRHPRIFVKTIFYLGMGGLLLWGAKNHGHKITEFVNTLGKAKEQTL